MPPFKYKNRRNLGYNFGELPRFNPYVLTRYRTPTKEHAASALLHQLMMDCDYEKALKLYKAILQSARYDIANLWELGVELIGRLVPERLTDFLYACYIASQGELRVVVFDAYIENLMIEERWKTAIEELETRCHRKRFKRKTLLKKLQVCRDKLQSQEEKRQPKKSEF
ncbi:hypothetical protein BY458DRAFT_504268 [Sporodiniella umbellata]|nr:hypothetical protein BY458DRAFT_504268 [Sporodiniella umbellata]